MATDETVRRHYRLCFGLRPDEELYRIETDPYQMNNLADNPRFSEVKAALKKDLTDYMKRTGDPRALGRGEIFQRYPVWCSGQRGKLGGINIL